MKLVEPLNRLFVDGPYERSALIHHGSRASIEGTRFKIGGRRVL
jgi:hypothetical protein